MGSNVITGESLHLHVPGGIWKASRLIDGSAGFALISEAVSPGFDFADMQLGNRESLERRFPSIGRLLKQMTEDQG
jgi:uncharacterized protein